MNTHVALKFWLGCSIIVLSAFLSFVLPVLLTSIVTILAVIYLIQQRYQNDRQLKYLLGQEKKKRQAADMYISASIPIVTPTKKRNAEKKYTSNFGQN